MYSIARNASSASNQNQTKTIKNETDNKEAINAIPEIIIANWDIPSPPRNPEKFSAFFLNFLSEMKNLKAVDSTWQTKLTVFAQRSSAPHLPA
ncbi:hypothetical protein TNIN_494471 [Trichonephila inaurata madagascariensis]|uniref:Uncharacterized protein n=1 Tax=Trichonephila inaurata madagascariensis TaxID=2747483 RepID=A0A8X6K9Z2_9ARAC|nr:hypothetical protein TNIN_494471 [Trichonephila inaurata madagascariensis]